MKNKEMLYIRQNGDCYIDKDCKWGNKNQKESPNKNIIDVTDNDLTFFKMCIYFMRDKLDVDNKRYEDTLFGLSYCTTPEPEKSVYENMIDMNDKTITQCSEWLKRLEDV